MHKKLAREEKKKIEDYAKGSAPSTFSSFEAYERRFERRNPTPGSVEAGKAFFRPAVVGTRRIINDVHDPRNDFAGQIGADSTFARITG